MYEAEKKARRYERVFGERVLKPLHSTLIEMIQKKDRVTVALDWEAGTGLLTRDLLKSLPSQSTLLVSEQDRGCLRVLHHKNDIEQDSRCFVKQAMPQELGLVSGAVQLAFAHIRWQFMADVEPGLAELRRVMRANGQLIMSFIQPSLRGSLVDRLKKIKAQAVLANMEHAGFTMSHVRQLLHKNKIFQIQTQQVQLNIQIGSLSAPHLDSLWLESLLPWWLPDQTAELDLGDQPLYWLCEIGLIHAFC